MTIRIKKDRIEFTANGGSTFTLAESNTGFTFDGTISAGNIFQDGFQGTVAGYTSGSYLAPVDSTNTIDKFPFTNDSNATDVGDLSQKVTYSAGQSSSSYGYTSGGDLVAPGAGFRAFVDKFPFSTNSNATNIGNLSQTRSQVAGQSSSINGYTSGGQTAPGAAQTTIDKFPFATDAASASVGALTQARIALAGQSSSISGYSSGGQPAPGALNTIDKFPFATDNNAKDVGDLTTARYLVAGQSSTTHGYVSSGYLGAAASNTIDKFPFATDTNATDVGDLTRLIYYSTGQSSSTFGYNSGGTAPPVPGTVNSIEKFPFSADTNSATVGALTRTSYGSAGQQN